MTIILAVPLAGASVAPTSAAIKSAGDERRCDMMGQQLAVTVAQGAQAAPPPPAHLVPNPSALLLLLAATWFMARRQAKKRVVRREPTGPDGLDPAG